MKVSDIKVNTVSLICCYRYLYIGIYAVCHGVWIDKFQCLRKHLI